MISAGEYSVWFRTPVGEGAGVVQLLPNGHLTGRDSTFTYSGSWTQVGERFNAQLLAKRSAPGPAGVFGMDEVDIVIVGKSQGETTASCIGYAKQSPGLKLDVTLIRMSNE